MNRISSFTLLLVLGLAVAFVGCDTTENDPIDENVVGTWDTETASIVFAGISVPVYEAGDEGTLAITFRADNTFTFVAAGPIVIDSSIPGVPTTEVLPEGEGATIEGSYEFTAGTGAITFAPSEVDGNPLEGVPATPVPVTFEDENTAVLTVENTDEGRALLGFLLDGQVSQEIIDEIDGGEITFRRN